MGKQYYVYIMTNRHNTVLYTGVTNNLMKRVFEHKEGLANGFTKNITYQDWYITKYVMILIRPFHERNRSKLVHGRRR